MGDATGQLAQAFQSLHAQKLLLEFLLFGNIGCDRQEPIDRAGTVTKWSNRDEQIEGPSVTSDPTHLMVGKWFAPQRTLVEDVGFLARVVVYKRHSAAENL